MERIADSENVAVLRRLNRVSWTPAAMRDARLRAALQTRWQGTRCCKYVHVSCYKHAQSLLVLESFVNVVNRSSPPSLLHAEMAQAAAVFGQPLPIQGCERTEQCS